MVQLTLYQLKITTTGFVSINLNPLLDTESHIVDSDYLEIVNERVFAYFENARAEGVYEDRMMRKVKSFLSGRVHVYDCQATGHQLVCLPDGRLGVCQEGVGSDRYFFSNVDTDFDFHSCEIISEWNSRAPLNMPQCKYCEAIGICGGGCAYGAELRNGSIWSLDDRFCKHSLQSLEWLIWGNYSGTRYCALVAYNHKILCFHRPETHENRVFSN